MSIELVIPRGNPAKLFETTEEPPDGVWLRVAVRVVEARVPALAPG